MARFDEGHVVREDDFTQTSAGAGDARKVPLLDADGKLDDTFLKVAKRTVFTANGTYTKSAGLKFLLVRMWAGGGPGGSFPEPAGANSTKASGASGGEFSEMWIPAADIGATEAVVVGAGGVASTGAAGGNSSFGTHLYAQGGSGPSSATNSPPGPVSGPNGGDYYGIGFPHCGVGGGNPIHNDGGDGEMGAVDFFYELHTFFKNGTKGGGAGGIAANQGATAGGNSVWGGAGSGAAMSSGTSLGAPGVSVFGGDAGAASGASGVAGSPGGVRGGAGGNWMGNTGHVTALGGDGGRGEVHVYEFF